MKFKEIFLQLVCSVKEQGSREGQVCANPELSSARMIRAGSSGSVGTF